MTDPIRPFRGCQRLTDLYTTAALTSRLLTEHFQICPMCSIKVDLLRMENPTVSQLADHWASVLTAALLMLDTEWPRLTRGSDVDVRP